MLTDIFAARYANVPMWTAFRESDRRFVIQAYRIIEEQLYLPYVDGKTNEPAQAKWKVIHDRMSTELGLRELSQRAYAYQTTWNGKPYTQTGMWQWDWVCKEYVCKNFEKEFDPDVFIKNRISFFEIAFREFEAGVNASNAALPAQRLEWQRRQAAKPGGYRMPDPGTVDESSWVEKFNKELNEKFRNAVAELNTRLRQAGYKLNYHNGFIQISADTVVEQQIETPFWSLVADPKWQNVDTDMKEAIDLRDTDGRDPAWYAARALESTIKIISSAKGWTHGAEKGAHNFIDNLASKKANFVTDWEASLLKDFFTKVRNPFGHGPGDAPMPALTPQQTNWSIEFCMIWIKGLIQRM